MGNNIHSSSRPKALAPSIPMPPLADAMSAKSMFPDVSCHPLPIHKSWILI